LFTEEIIVKRLFVVILVLSAVQVRADDLMKDFDSLGGNKVLLDEAKSLSPDKRVKIVQKRIVNRFKRFEFLPEYEHVTSGENSYLDTNSLAMSTQFHLNPHISFGLKYVYNMNKLTNEGKTLITTAQRRADLSGRVHDELKDPFIPQLNWPKEEKLAFVNFYPIYGKMNVFDMGVVQFDVYGLLSGGKIKLRYNSSNLYQAGLGIGLWWSQHLTIRLEVKYQTYKANYYDQTRKVENSAVSLGVGFLL